MSASKKLLSEIDSLVAQACTGDMEPGLLVEQLYDRIGTGGILLHLEDLHRRDAQRAGETDLNHAGDHTYVAWALRAARVVSDDAAGRLRGKVGA